MFFRRTKLFLAVASATLLAGPASVYATNGYFAHGYGTASKAMGGAGVAMSQENGAMAAATNPSGMAFVGDRYDLGMEYFAPHRCYSISGSGFSGMNNDQCSDREWFLIPSMAGNLKVGSDGALGITVYGNGGMNTRYHQAVFGFFGGSAPTGVDLMQVFMPITYAQKVTSGSSLGISAVPVMQRFKAEGLQPFAAISEDPNHVSEQGYQNSYGMGVKIGGQANVGGGVSIGAAYQPMINMGKFTHYAGLFAGGGGFDIPSNYTLGVAWKVLSNWTILFDYERINYEDVKSVSNPSFVPPPFGPSGAKLGNPNGPGFGWQNINVYKLGTQVTTGSWTWRGGWNHGDNPIQAPQNAGDVGVMFNILAPGVITDHLTLGFGKTLSANSILNVSAMYAPWNEVTGQIPTDAAHFGGGTVMIGMRQWSAEASIDVKF